MKNTILFLGLVVTLFSCVKEKTIPVPVSATDCFEISYKYNVRPIIETSCKTQAGPGTGCHDAWIDDYSQIQGLINNQKWQNRTFSLLDMPVMPNIWGIDSLTLDEIQTMECWIEQGYPEN